MSKLTAADAAKYWGCQMRYSDGDWYTLDGKILSAIERGAKCMLSLRPLSKIIDDDAIEVAKMLGFSNDPMFKYRVEKLLKQQYGDVLYCKPLHEYRDVIDFLRSRSYDCDNFISQGKAIEI